MNKIQHIIYCLLSAMLLTVLTSGCQDEPIYTGTSSDSISFRVSVSKENRELTRGFSQMQMFQPIVPLESESGKNSLYLHPIVSEYEEDETDLLSRSNMVTSQDGMYDEFYVSAYQYEDAWSEEHLSEAPNYFQSQTARRGGNFYVINPSRYWPESGKIRFLAHAPTNDDAFTFYPTDDAARGARVHINISDDVKKQNDLLVSYSEEMMCNGATSAAPLNFKHALTGIRFVCDKSMIKGIITNITIKGVRYEGDFFYNMHNAGQATSSDLVIDENFNPWEIYDKEFSLDLNFSVTGQDSEEINGGENTFVMFPQLLPESAIVEITLQHIDSNGNPTQQFEHISGSLAGREWPAGKIVTYKITGSDQILEVQQPAVFNYLGSVYDSSSDTMLSYNSVRVGSSAGTKNMKWKVEYQDEGSSSWSDTSSWLSIDPSWTWQDLSEQDVRFMAKSDYNEIDIDANLKKAASKGSATVPYNLSNASGGATVENTANCYMVSSPGYYILPLVYGNAITNSATNQKSYIYTTASGSDILSKFVNHLNAPITAPYIADNAGCVADHASIVWQDAQNLVSDVQYVPTAFGGKGGVKFFISQASIAQGNAVIAINDKNNVMWSWHIWVTDFSGFDNTVDVTNQDNQTFTLMPVNLGWCSNKENIRYYPRRECKVRFTPIEGDLSLSKEITFVQESHTSIPFGNNPYYQWGRKDPFVGTNIAWGNKERWDGSGKYYGTGSENNPPRLFNDLVEDSSQERLTTVQCLDLLIKNPDKWHNPPAIKGGTSYVSANKIYNNLWGDNTLTDSKTVYDPCPPGYQVNYFYTYTGFLASDYNWSSDKGIRFVKQTASDWDSTNLAEFYTDASNLHSITFPVCGYRDWNDKAEVVDFTVRGFVWMRGCNQNVDCYMFRYAPHITGQTNVAPVTMFYATDGLPVRPGLSK